MYRLPILFLCLFRAACGRSTALLVVTAKLVRTSSPTEVPGSACLAGRDGVTTAHGSARNEPEGPRGWAYLLSFFAGKLDVSLSERPSIGGAGEDNAGGTSRQLYALKKPDNVRCRRREGQASQPENIALQLRFGAA